MRPYDEALENCTLFIYLFIFLGSFPMRNILYNKEETLFMKLTLQFDDLIMALMDEGKIRPPFVY